MSDVAKLLISWARKIGRWIVERLLETGAHRLGAYMIERADSVFRKRLARAKTERRKKWLRGKIGRWIKAGEWLINASGSISTCVAVEADTLVAKAAKLPFEAKCERMVAA